MCNVEDNDKSSPTPKTKSLVGAPCVKCCEPGVLITRIHDSFCKDCFQVYTVHKFRSAIGKSKLIRDGEKVLVAFSGGANSAALLHLIQDGLSLRAHKRLRFTPTLIHVDETGLFNDGNAIWKKRQDKIKQIMLRSGFPSYWTQLEQCNAATSSNIQTSGEINIVTCDGDNRRKMVEIYRLDGDTPDDVVFAVPPEQTQMLRSLIKNLGNNTAQEDFVHNLRNQLLVLAARQLGFTKVLTAETATRLAIRILSDVSQGRGGQVSLDTGISDERNTGIMFMRPVRDLNAKELAMYNSLFEVDSVFMPTLTTKTGLASSIERLTETFVTGLQAEFPSTVSNIVRTSEKLGLPDLKGTEKCTFCQSPLDTKVGKASALGAVLFSQKISQGLYMNPNSNSVENDGPAVINGCETLPNSNSNQGLTVNSMESVTESLCFGCRLSLSAFSGDIQDLPNFLREKAAARNRERQRQQISDYLLDDAPV